MFMKQKHAEKRFTPFGISNLFGSNIHTCKVKLFPSGVFFVFNKSSNNRMGRALKVEICDRK